MSDSNPERKSIIELSTLTLFERKEYEELKRRYAAETKRLRKKRVFLGMFVITFLALLAGAGLLQN